MVVLRARLQTVKKVQDGEPYFAKRWAWKIGQYPPGTIVRLLAYGADGKIDEAFDVPAERLENRRGKCLYRYQTHRDNRVGSFLERYKVALLASEVERLDGSA